MRLFRSRLDVFHRKWPKRCKKEPKNRVISISIFRVPLFFEPRGRRETTPKPPRSAPRGPRAAQETSRAAFGGLRASFWSLRDLFFTFFTTFSAPQKSHLVHLILSYRLSLCFPYLIFNRLFFSISLLSYIFSVFSFILSFLSSFFSFLPVRVKAFFSFRSIFKPPMHPEVLCGCL